MELGPVEYIGFAFPCNEFGEENAPALKRLVDSGTVAITYLAFVVMDAEGDVTAIGVEESGADVRYERRPT